MTIAHVSTCSQIFANNYPLPKTAVDQLDAIRTGPTGFNVAFLAIFALGFLQASFAVFLVTERVNKSKAIQFISGAQAWVFWLTSFIWDMLTSTLVAILITILFAIFNIPAYSGSNLGYVFLLFWLFGFSALPLVYCLTFAFSSSSGSYARLVVLFAFGGLAQLLIVRLHFACSAKCD